jgi:hypothetical protein
LSWEERERRIGANEALFRDVNERLKEASGAFSIGPQELDLVCECADTECAERVSVSMSVYEHVRSDPQLFIVASGHAARGEVEVVVERRNGYDIVSKTGISAQIAEQTDPRS